MFSNCTQNRIHTITTFNEIDPSITFANYSICFSIYENLDRSSSLYSPITICYLLSLIHLASRGEVNNRLSLILGIRYQWDDLYRFGNLMNNFKSLSWLLYDKRKQLNKDYLTLIEPFIIPQAVEKEKEFIINKHINQQIFDQTYGINTNLLTDTNFPCSLHFINSTTFRINWLFKFDPNATRQENFHGSSSEKTNLMNQVSLINYFENNQFQLGEIPLEMENIVFGIILPKRYLEQDTLDYDINNVPIVVESELKEMINNSSYQIVDLYLPRFSISRKLNIKLLFQKMGHDMLFSPQTQLDMIGENLSLSDMTINSCLILDETGSLPAPIFSHSQKKIMANHVFLYYLRDKESDLIIAMGDYQGDSSMD